jgi:HlyD family secretion protein
MASNKNRIWIKRLAHATVLGALVAGGCSRNAAPTYQTTPVTRGGITNVVTATGALNPVLNVTVGCQVSGRISKLYADFNSPVTNGQLIAEIDPRTYQAAVAQAQADLANATANQELQEAEAERAMDLFTNKLISQSDHDTAIATLHEADAMVQIKQASLSNAMANLGYCRIYSPVDGTVISRAVDVGQTVAASLSAPTLFQIANDLTKMQIDSAVAEADVGGVVEGQRVDFTVDAYPYRTFHGGVVQVRNAPTTVNNVVTYDCVIGVTNADYKLKPGMTANVSIVVAEMDDVLKIPNGAMRFRPLDPAAVQAPTNAPANAQNVSATNGGARFGGGSGGPGGRRFGQGGGGGFGRGGGHGDRQMRTVYVLADSKNDAPQLRPVQIRVGISDGINTEVLDGLKEGDVIVSGMTGGAQAAAPAGNPFGGGGGFPRRF